MSEDNFADAVDCRLNGINKIQELNDDIKYADETINESMDNNNQAYEPLQKGHSVYEEDRDNFCNEIMQYSGDESCVNRLTSVESGALASESDNLDADEYLTPIPQQYAEIVDRDIITEMSPAGSQIIKERQHIVRVPFLRGVSRILRPNVGRRKKYATNAERNKSKAAQRNKRPDFKRQASIPMKAVSVVCSPQLIVLVVLVVIICVAMAVVLTVMFNLFNKKTGSPESAAIIGDSIPPDLSCPASQTVVLSHENEHVILEDASSQNNLGIAKLEYKPVIADDSAIFQPPTKLIVSRKSIGRTYMVRVTATDYSNNEAVCNYTITVQEDLCVPWRLPDIPHSKRQITETGNGLEVTYQCHNNTTTLERAPRIISYHHLAGPATYTCKTGNDFTPRITFSCQEARLAKYEFITSLEYKFLDSNDIPLKNITVGKSQSCFSKFYKNGIISIQQDISSNVLEKRIKDTAVLYSTTDLSDLELRPILPGYPEITAIKESDGLVEGLTVAIGYKVIPEDHPFSNNLINSIVTGTLRSKHTNVFNEGMMLLSRVEGSINSRCPAIQAPLISSKFEEVSSGFICEEGEKRIDIYDERVQGNIEVCIGCPIGEYYDVTTESCLVCPRNTYQDEIGKMHCKDCPLNTGTSHNTAIKIEDCKPT